MHSARRLLCLIVMTATLLGLASFSTASEGDSYPLRPYYPEVPYITTEDLMDEYYNTRVVDIRSKFEYDVARINRAFLLPLNDPTFPAKLARLRPKDDPTPLVFYCNGHTCAKSYQAAQLAISLGFIEVFVYDGGIFDWIQAAPTMATLMGETPARAERVITDSRFYDRQLNYDTFHKQSLDENTIVIDIRDPFQREVAPRIPGIKNIPLDPLLDLVISRIWTEKRLLFFDAVGKQVRWLQYFLESYGYFDYGFLEGGVRSISEDANMVKPVIETNRSIVTSQEMLLTLTGDERLNNSDRKVLSFLLANVKFNNYIVVDLAKATQQIGMTKPLILNSVKKLSRFKYTEHSVMQNNLIVQIDPRLAWKGNVGDKTWADTIKEFNDKVRK